MTEQDASAASDLASISTESELRVAVLSLLGDSYDRAVERRTGLSKTTVNDLRNQRRRLTIKTLTMIVDTYDPTRRDAWLAVWHRVRPRAAPAALPPDAATGPTTDSARPRSVDGAAVDGADASVDAVAAAIVDDDDDTDLARQGDDSTTNGKIRKSSHPLRISRRRLRLAFGAALAVACVVAVTVTIAILVVPRGNAGITAQDSGGSAVPSGSPAPVGSVGPGGPGAFGPPLPFGPLPPLVPGGPGAAGPVGGPEPIPVDAVSPPGGSPVVPHGCSTLPLETKADVVEQPGARAAGVRLTAASYTYYPAWNPSLAIGGQLSGRLPEGQRLVGADWADPATQDSTSAHSFGNGRFYPGGELELSDQNCFTVPPYNIGYGGYAGITTRVYIMLVDEASVKTFPGEAAQLAGFTEADLAKRGVDVLGYFVVPSPAM